ncbi:hypothetical protein Chor_010781 [Crotalus horridus]
MRPATMHTINLQTSSLRNLRLPKRLRVVYFFARTRLAQRIIMTGTVVWIGILVYTDPAGFRLYLASQVTEQSPLGDAGLPVLPVPGEVLPTGDAKLSLSVFSADAGRTPPPPLSENLTSESARRRAAGRRAEEPLNARSRGHPEVGSTAEVTWGAEDEELWRKLYISILPVIPVTLYLDPQEALEARHPHEASRYPSPSSSSGVVRAEQAERLAEEKPKGHTPRDVTLRRRRGDLPCDDYGYSPPETEIIPLVLRGHLMDIECLASDGMLLVSCCLVGQIRVWDAQTGDCLTVIPKQGDQPDLSSLIDTNFSERGQSGAPGARLRTLGLRSEGYDFRSLVGQVREEPPGPLPDGPSFSARRRGEGPECESRRRSSWGDEPLPAPEKAAPPPPFPWGSPSESSIWSLELQGNFIAAGRSNGRLEVWDAIEGTLQCSSEDGPIVAARLNGSLDFYSLRTPPSVHPTPFQAPPGRNSLPSPPVYSASDVLACHLTHTVTCAHQKPITALKAAAGRLVTGSQDHTLRVRTGSG